jgi:hypothetical protein
MWPNLECNEEKRREDMQNIGDDWPNYKPSFKA